MRMNILFVHSLDDVLSPNRPLRTPEQMQFGISYISSVLKGQGYNTKLVVLSRMFGKNNIRNVSKIMDNFNPRLICFTAVYSEYYFLAKIARYIKSRYPDIFLMIGGPHVSLNPDEVISDSFDALCIGEGEYPTLELILQLDKGKYPSGIPNLWIKHDSGIEKNPVRRFLQDLDSLPFPDREIWQEWIGEMPDCRNPVLLGRGCPFSCTYCCNPALRSLAEGPYVRFRSPDNILKEIKEVAIRFPEKKDFNLEVETIGVDKEWFIELCSKLEHLNASLSQPLSYITNLRITPHLDLDTFFSALKKSNFTAIKIGLESGSEKIRREILKRDYSNQDILNAVSLARRYGLKVIFYNLIGVPGESREDYQETIRVNRRCLPDRTIPHVFFPYPGTGLYSLCKEQGLLPKPVDTTLERCKATLDLPGFSRKQIQNAFVWFEYDIYKGYKPLYRILAKTLVSKFLSNTYLHDIYRKLTYLKLIKQLRRIVKVE